MFVCLDCGHVFDEPHHWEERHGFNNGPFEQLSGCPKCGEAYVETYMCDCCNQWIVDAYIKTEDGQRYCHECYCKCDLGDEN